MGSTLICFERSLGPMELCISRWGWKQAEWGNDLDKKGRKKRKKKEIKWEKFGEIQIPKITTIMSFTMLKSYP